MEDEPGEENREYIVFRDTVEDLTVNIAINKPTHIANSELIHEYIKMDRRLEKLLFFIKDWSKASNSPLKNQNLSSFAIQNMLIAYM